MTSLPLITSLTHSPDSTLAQVLDLLFEPSPPLHKLTLPVLRSTTFPTYDTLIVAVQAQLAALATSDSQDDIVKLSEILCSHPRLGEKKVDSEQSRKEQAQLQGNEEEGRKLKALNDEYEKVFPGLRYVYVLYISFFSNHLHVRLKSIDRSLNPIPIHQQQQFFIQHPSPFFNPDHFIFHKQYL